MTQTMNLLASEVRSDPYPTYRRLRDEHPVCEIAPGGFYAVSRYDDVMQVLRSPQKFSSRGYLPFMLPRWLAVNPMTRSVLARDPPDHTVLRTRLGRALAARLTPALTERTQRIAEELCERPAALDGADFIAELAAPLPARIFAELCGLDPELHPRFKQWADHLSAISPAITRPAHIEAIQRTVQEVDTYLRQVLAERRRAPGSDLVSELLATDAQGQRLDEEDVLGLLCLLLPAGFDTTTYLLSACARILAERPDEHARLRENPEAIDGFIDEVLRYDSPVHGIMRLTVEPVELAEVELPAGAIVCALLASANRDERKFADPDCFNPALERAKDLAFGHGIHYCLGATLARMEVRVALRTLLARYTKVELMESPLRWNTSLIIRGPLAQKMRWSARPATVRVAVAGTRPAQVIKLQTQDAELPLAPLSELLAAEISAQFGERVLVLHQGQPTHPGGDYDVVLLAGDVPRPASLPVGAVVGLHDAAAASPRPDASCRRLSAVLAAPGVGVEPFAAMPVAELANAERPFQLRIPPALLRAGAGLRSLDGAQRDSLSRWARVLTGRQVGLALSGGGAWGFTHIALLRKLHAQRIPIDLICGSSMGSVIGAYYCARGLDGVELLVERARSGEINRLVRRALVSTAVVQRMVERDLGTLMMMSSLSPRFHALLTDIDRGEDVVATSGSLALAVRASSSAPLLFAPTLIEGRRFVDGSMSNHVPADAARAFGADLVLAASCYPRGRRKPALNRSRWCATWKSLDPLARLSDLFSSAHLLLQRSGRHGAAAADVLYEIAPHEAPLRWAMDYRKVDDVLALAECDAQLDAAVAELTARFRALCGAARKPAAEACAQKEAA